MKQIISSTSCPRVVSDTDDSRPFWPHRAVPLTQPRLCTARRADPAPSPEFIPVLTGRKCPPASGPSPGLPRVPGTLSFHSFGFLFKCPCIRKASLWLCHPTPALPGPSTLFPSPVLHFFTALLPPPAGGCFVVEAGCLRAEVSSSRKHGSHTRGGGLSSVSAVRPAHRTGPSS